MIRLWGQAQFSIKTKRLSGYELFLREQKHAGGPWRLPDNISLIDPAKMVALLQTTLASMPKGLDFVTFNLDESQFVQPEYVGLLANLKHSLPCTLGIELTERHGDAAANVNELALVAAAKRYHDAGWVLCLDDVGTGANDKQLVCALDPYVSEYKYAIQNVRQTLPTTQIVEEIATWRNRAKQLDKAFTLEGLENPVDLNLIQRFAPDYVQGYYFGKPHFLATSADFASGDICLSAGC